MKKYISKLFLATCFIINTVGYALEIHVNDFLTDIKSKKATIESKVEPTKKGDKVTVKWEQVAGDKLNLINPTSQKLEVTGYGLGGYKLKITATDDKNQTVSQTINFQVVDLNNYNFVSATNPNIKYVGRFVNMDKFPEAGWSGAKIKMKFTGKSAIIKLMTGAWPKSSANYFAIIDGDDANPIFLQTSNQSLYLIADNLEDTEHTLELFRLNGAWTRTSKFYGVYLDKDKELLPLNEGEKLKLEFYGDSITEGSFMDGQSYGTNSYYSYASVCARELNADAVLVCKGGLGLVEGVYAGGHNLQKVYNRPNPWEHKKSWDFKQYTPDFVIINILQNDSWLQRKTADKVYYDAYFNFLKNIRKEYPNAKIICALGSMDIVSKSDKWINLVNDVVKEFKEKNNDLNVYTFFFTPIKEKRHPNKQEAEIMGKNLADFIREHK